MQISPRQVRQNRTIFGNALRGDLSPLCFAPRQTQPPKVRMPRRTGSFLDVSVVRRLPSDKEGGTTPSALPSDKEGGTTPSARTQEAPHSLRCAPAAPRDRARRHRPAHRPPIVMGAGARPFSSRLPLARGPICSSQRAEERRAPNPPHPRPPPSLAHAILTLFRSLPFARLVSRGSACSA